MENIIGICNELAWESWQSVDRNEIDSYYIRASIEIYEEILYQLSIFYCIDNGLEELVDNIVNDIDEFAIYPNFTIRQNAEVYKIYKNFKNKSDINVSYIKTILDNLVNPLGKLSYHFNYTEITKNNLYDCIDSLFEKLHQIQP